jgi:hypothetical protein
MRRNEIASRPRGVHRPPHHRRRMPMLLPLFHFSSSFKIYSLLKVRRLQTCCSCALREFRVFRKSFRVRANNRNIYIFAMFSAASSFHQMEMDDDDCLSSSMGMQPNNGANNPCSTSLSKAELRKVSQAA